MAKEDFRFYSEATLVRAGSAALRTGCLPFLLKTEDRILHVCMLLHRSIPEGHNAAVWVATFHDKVSDGFAAAALTDACHASTLAATPKQACLFVRVADLNLQDSNPFKPSIKDGSLSTVVVAAWVAVFLANVTVSSNAVASFAAHNVSRSNPADLIDHFSAISMQRICLPSPIELLPNLGIDQTAVRGKQSPIPILIQPDRPEDTQAFQIQDNLSGKTLSLSSQRCRGKQKSTELSASYQIQILLLSGKTLLQWVSSSNLV